MICFELFTFPVCYSSYHSLSMLCFEYVNTVQLFTFSVRMLSVILVISMFCLAKFCFELCLSVCLARATSLLDQEFVNFGSPGISECGFVSGVSPYIPGSLSFRYGISSRKIEQQIAFDNDKENDLVSSGLLR